MYRCIICIVIICIMQYNVMPSNISLFFQDLSGLELNCKYDVDAHVKSGAPCKPSSQHGKAPPLFPFMHPITCLGKSSFSCVCSFQCHKPDDHQQYRLNVNNHYSKKSTFYSGRRFSSINDMPFHAAASRPVSHPAVGINIRMASTAYLCIHRHARDTVFLSIASIIE